MRPGSHFLSIGVYALTFATSAMAWDYVPNNVIEQFAHNQYVHTLPFSSSSLSLAEPLVVIYLIFLYLQLCSVGGRMLFVYFQPCPNPRTAVLASVQAKMLQNHPELCVGPFEEFFVTINN